LREQHPLLTLELVVSNEASELLRRDVDLALRNVRPTQTGLVGRRSARLRWACTRTAAARADRGSRPAVMKQRARSIL
jgi:DNA-binding transcriptional LysR family regulator